ncbi:MAG: NPCBM/NEW2 domain-containing protein [Thermoguttaceae bacterium]|jgi:hypothetical protein
MLQNPRNRRLANMFCLVFLFVFGFLRLLLAEDPSADELPPVRVVYFTPADSEPGPDAPVRLCRVMNHVREFYRKEMERLGYGPMTFALDLDPTDPSRLSIRHVKGKYPVSFYGKGNYRQIYKEVSEALKGGTNGLRPIHPSSEVVVIFQRLTTATEEGEPFHRGPIVGSGNHLFGIALAMDDDHLNPELLTSDTPVTPGGKLSLGEFNTRYIGALAHELGHAFGLLHNAETDAQRRVLGYSLMGLGNNYYAREERGEGKGAFLTEADGMRLSRCRAFAGDIPYAFTQPKWRILLLQGKLQRKENGEIELLLKGRFDSDVPLAGVIAYNDDSSVPGDYDAKSFITRPDSDGNFSMTITELTETGYQLRLAGIGVQGAVFDATVTYEVDEKLSPDGLRRLNSFAPEFLMRRLFECWNIDRLQEVVWELERRGADPILIRKGRHLLRRMTDPPHLVSPDEVADDVNNMNLSEALWVDAHNGIDRILRDRVPQELFITAGGDYYESGIFAHAPSLHRFRLGKKWSTFTSLCGISDGHCGSVRFRVIGDGKELYTGPVVQDHLVREISILVEGVEVLDLVVEPGDDGNSQDWGLWIQPALSR